MTVSSDAAVYPKLISQFSTREILLWYIGHQNAVSSACLKEQKIFKCLTHHLYVVGSRCKFRSYKLTFWKYKHYHESEITSERLWNLTRKFVPLVFHKWGPLRFSYITLRYISNLKVGGKKIAEFVSDSSQNWTGACFSAIFQARLGWVDFDGDTRAAVVSDCVWRWHDWCGT